MKSVFGIEFSGNGSQMLSLANLSQKFTGISDARLWDLNGLLFGLRSRLKLPPLQEMFQDWSNVR